MKVSELIGKGIVTLEDIKDFISGYDGWESTREAMNEATGFAASYLDLRFIENEDDDYSDEEIMNAEIIDGGEWFNNY